MQGPGWVPVSCINCTDRGCLCVCVCLRLLLLWPGPVLAVPIGFYVPACLLQHFPLEMTGLLPLSPGPLCHLPSVICWQLPCITFVPKLCPSAPDLRLLHFEGRSCQPPLTRLLLGVSPLPSVKGRESQRRRCKGGLNLGPSPPGVPVPAPSHPGRGGGPGKGPPLHRCCRPRTAGTVLGVELGAQGPDPPGTQEQRRQLLLGSAL